MLRFLVVLSLFATTTTAVVHRRFSSPSYRQFAAPSPYKYETKYFTQQIDNFGFDEHVGVYSQRYLINLDYWKPGKPIFFYTGNEGDIAWFCNNTGFMWDIAPEFDAMLLFAEHRYYGDSLPFGAASFETSQNLQYLTSEQALADFAVLITHVKATQSGAQESPVIAFGGSYGGMLAAWFRMKYPNVVAGAIAASAPIWQFADLVSCDTFDVIASRDYRRTPGGEQCYKNIQALWSTLNETSHQEHGMLLLSTIFDVCNPVWDVNVFIDWLNEIFGNLAMMDYPYPASFMESLPAWPVSVACSFLNESTLQGEDLLRAASRVVNMYFNYTGGATCFNTSSQGVSYLGDQGWDYQACTEMIMPFCSSSETSMFPPARWDGEAYAASCTKTWNVTSRPDWVIVQYGGKEIKSRSNIVFSNGDLDPWSGGGVTMNLSDTLTAIVIADGAHHLDLRAANPDDPQSVINARNVEKEHIKKWIGV